MSEFSMNRFRNRIDIDDSCPRVWQTVKDKVEFSLSKRRDGIMLFLDDLHLQLGAYHPVGMNNVVLNKVLAEIARASIKDKHAVNVLVYTLFCRSIGMRWGNYHNLKLESVWWKLQRLASATSMQQL